MAAWSVLWHWATEPPLRSTPWQPHRGFSQERANICFWSIYFPQTRSSEHENQRFRTHILSLNPSRACLNVWGRVRMRKAEAACVQCLAVCHETPSFDATIVHASCVEMFSTRMRSSTRRPTRSFASGSHYLGMCLVFPATQTEQNLGQAQRPIVEPEGADAERLDPERPGELVQGNGGTVHSAPHERGPGLRHGIDGHAVIIVHKPERDAQGVRGAAAARISASPAR